jgi:hypothetical protein
LLAILFARFSVGAVFHELFEPFRIGGGSAEKSALVTQLIMA